MLTIAQLLSLLGQTRTRHSKVTYSDEMKRKAYIYENTSSPEPFVKEKLDTRLESREHLQKETLSVNVSEKTFPLHRH